MSTSPLTVEEDRRKGTYVDDQHRCPTPSNPNPIITHGPGPLPGLRPPTANLLALVTPVIRVILELTLGGRRTGIQRSDPGCSTAQRRQTFDHRPAARRIPANGHLPDGGCGLSLKRHVKCRFIIFIQVQAPPRHHELKEERDLVRDAKRQDRWYK